MSASEDDLDIPSQSQSVRAGRGRGGRGRAGGGRGRANAAPPLERLLRPSAADKERGNASVTALQSSGPEVVREEWLSVPDEFMKPLKMSVVNQFVRCIPEKDFRFRSYGEEYVLVGTGNTMPENFRKWIYCMHQVKVTSFGL